MQIHPARSLAALRVEVTQAPALLGHLALSPHVFSRACEVQYMGNNYI